ncbi:hypothetical protein CASFOL_006923 [Castilleja foliolosa]|uniref:Uncharacterized protein n=1 Tax=Castilleja foliolosa TaxID=1961234 RepID=A0ABD3E7R4_9LAMI
MECVKVTAGVRKPKKKHVKDELDRIKQAEKKKRRLEKALATSAAIRLELEKKKLKKKEEQERLDEEGAAIAEAVALQVLLDEDSDDSKKKDELIASRDHASNIGFVMGPTQRHHSYNLSKYYCENVGRVFSNYNQQGRTCNLSGYSNPRYFRQGVWGSVGLSADHLAAQAVSSLRIADDARVNAFYFNPFVRG